MDEPLHYVCGGFLGDGQALEEEKKHYENTLLELAAALEWRFVKSSSGSADFHAQELHRMHR